MPVDGLTYFDFSRGVESVSQFSTPDTLPDLAPAPPVFGDAPLRSEVDNLFEGYRLDHIVHDSLAPPSATLNVLGRESLCSLVNNKEPLLLSVCQEVTFPEVNKVAQLLCEESINQDLVSAFRRAVMGG